MAGTSGNGVLGVPRGIPRSHICSTNIMGCNVKRQLAINYLLWGRACSPGLCHMIYYQGDKKNPNLRGIGLIVKISYGVLTFFIIKISP